MMPAPLPSPVPLAAGAFAGGTVPEGAVLALGAYLKNRPCLVCDGQVLPGMPVGDLHDAAACARLEAEAARLLASCDRPLRAVAHDLHPDFHSSRLAGQLARRLNVPALAVQHHHAHVEAVLLEHGHAAPALGLALDGVGLGSDGTAWGGELLLAGGATFERLGHLRPLPLPGGDRAAREPWRMAAAVLHALGRGDEIARRFACHPAASRLVQVLERPHLCPRTSSLGRCFDAAAGLLGVCEIMQVDAEAAIALESRAAQHGPAVAQAGGWSIDADGQLDLLPLFARLADERDVGWGAACFHATLVVALADWVCRAAVRSGLREVVFSGGCFFNRLLRQGLGRALREQGLNVLEPQRFSPGDEAISLGQARVAVARLARVPG